MADIKQLAKNSEEAVKEFAADRTKENMVKLMGRLERGVLYVPVVSDAQITDEMKQTAQKDGQVALPKGTKIQTRLLKTNTDKMVFPVFTSTDEITQEDMKKQLMIMPFFECARAALSAGMDIEAVVINPFTDNVGIVEPLLKAAVERREIFLKAKEQGLGEPQTTEVQVTKKQFEQITRLQLELYNIPQMFFAGQKEFMDELYAKKGTYFYEMYQNAYGSQIPCPYEANQFGVMILNIKADVQMICVDLPAKKIQANMCYKLYMVWNQTTDEKHFFAIQKKKEGKMFLRVDASGKQEVISEAPTEGSEMSAVMDYLGMN